MKKVTIIVPAYNEASTLPVLVESLHRLAHEDIPASTDLTNTYHIEVLIINDGSTDDTPDILKQLRSKHPHLHYITLSRNFGKENALLAGIDHADADCVVLMDADMQHPVSAIPKMLLQWENGYHDIYGRRLSRGKEPLIRRQLTKAYYNILQKSTDTDMLPGIGDFRLLDRKCITALRSLRESQRYTKGLIEWIGFKKKGIDFHTADRQHGKSHFTTSRLITTAAEGITGFSTTPLRITTITGIIISLSAFAYITLILIKTIIYGEPVRGFPTIMCAILFLGGCQLLAIGIIGEYVARIYHESKHRPPYIIEHID